MRITQYIDHTIRLLLYLGSNQEDFKKIEDIADHYIISSNHLRKVMRHLSSLGYTETRRGPLGGIRLRRRPHEINIGRLFREIEPLHLIEQIDSPLFPFSNINERWKSMFDQALDAFLKELDQITLEELITFNPSLSFPLSPLSNVDD